jgi:hypothetical protein
MQVLKDFLEKDNIAIIVSNHIGKTVRVAIKPENDAAAWIDHTMEMLNNDNTKYIMVKYTDNTSGPKCINFEIKSRVASII